MRDETFDGGGAAFPNCNDGNIPGNMGMTLRDYLAAKAMQGICANPESVKGANKCFHQLDGDDFDQAAANLFSRLSYQIADAMLRERSKATK